MEKELRIKVELVPSAQDQADFWSRMPQDKGDYTMDWELFNDLEGQLAPFVKPQVDMFASPGNHQLPKFVSRYPHWQAVAHDSLNCHLEGFDQVYANSPRKIISAWLNRLRERSKSFA